MFLANHCFRGRSFVRSFVQVLDGRRVTTEECRASRDLQRHHLREFNRRIQIASDEAEREIHQIRAQRARQKNSAREMNKMLMEAFNELEACVMAGRRKILETLEQDGKVCARVRACVSSQARMHAGTQAAILRPDVGADSNRLFPFPPPMPNIPSSKA